MKKHYFFVTANFKFRKKYVNTQYNHDPSDVCAFTQKEIYIIEQKSDESDDVFFINLKKYIMEALGGYADLWIIDSNKKISANAGCQWSLDTIELDDISKIG